MKKKILKYLATYAAGAITVVIVLLIPVIPYLINPESAFDDLYPESSEVEAAVSFNVPKEVDVYRFIGMEASEIVDEISVADENYRAGLKSLFNSGIATEIEFKWKHDRSSHSTSFKIIDGIGSRPVWKSSSSVTITSD